MSIRQQKKKIRHLSDAITTKYFLADQQRALLEPIVYDKNLIQRWDNSLAAHGLEALRMSTYLSILSAMNALLFDEYAKTASIHNVCRMLDDAALVAALRDDYCKPIDIAHIGPDMDEGLQKHLEECINAQRMKEAADDFDARLGALLAGYDAIRISELAQRIQRTRDRVVSHYQVTTVGGERRLYDPSDFGLKWGDASEIVKASTEVVFNIPMIVTGTWYAVDDYVAGHNEIAAEFWKIT
jgi:hypothetical protein